jgi:fructose-1,6-bisphosphatase II
MHTDTRLNPPDPDHNNIRLVQFDLMRATEMAALNSLPWMGKGDPDAADAAACDAIRGMFDAMDIRGEIIVIGEGNRDQKLGLFVGERVGRWAEGTPRVDIAIDPLDGARSVSKGLPNCISSIAAAVRRDENVPELQFIPALYMKKLAYPAVVRRAWIKDNRLPLDINAPLSEVIRITARLLDKSIRDVVVMVLDRPKNQQVVEEIRSAGASLRMIVDGDISAAIAPGMPNSGIDLYAGIGGAPEGILAAAGLRCMGAGMQAQICPRDETERKSLAASGWGDSVDKVYRSRDLVNGDDILFIATGISDSPLLRGVQVKGSTVITQSVLMRLKSGSVRYMQTEHDLAQRPIRLRSQAEKGGVQVRGSNVDGVAPKYSGILLIGPPGCGKGTVGKALGRLPGFIHCSSGDVIRSAMSQKGALGDRLSEVAGGTFIADSDLWDLFDAYIEQVVNAESSGLPTPPLLIIDGIPRTLSQVDELSKRVNIKGVFSLEVGDPKMLVERILHRSTVESRADDSSMKVVQTRLNLFAEETLPVLDEYPDEIVFHIDANQPPAKVLYDILNKVQQIT